MSDVKMRAYDANVPYIAFSDSYKHPGKLVQTRSLQFATITVPSYEIRNEKVKLYLSDAQLDAVTMACDSFAKFLPSGHRQGFLLGDGAGVGKNRSLCGVLAETMYCQSIKRADRLYQSKAVFLTSSNALFDQTQNDLMEMNVKAPLFMLGSRNEGVHIGKKHGILYATYSLLITPGTRSISRLEQIMEWLGADFEGLIIFDECHNAKRYSVEPAESTKTGNKVVELQNTFPKARILYSSATGLSTIGNVGYLQRLGMYGPGTPYKNCSDFVKKSELRGLSAMELLVTELRAKGVFIARTLSMEGVYFDRLECQIDAALYNQSTLIWSMVYQYIKAVNKIDAKKISRFWQAHQRYFAALILSCKIDPVVERTRLELTKDKAIVIGLQSTGEARLRASLSKNNMQEEDKFCAAREMLFEVLVNIAEIEIDEDERAVSSSNLTKVQRLHNDGGENELLQWVESDWRIIPSYTFKQIKTNMAETFYSTDNCLLEQRSIHAQDIYTKMLRKKIIKKFKIVSDMFELNPIDDFVEKLGGETVVAELTGRSIKRELNADSNYENYNRNSQLENMKDYSRFMAGEKKVAIISEAFSTGVSLHNSKNLKKRGLEGARLHVTVEFSWSADRVIQQFGRTHRSNQMQPPTYLLVVSNVPGEERFLASITEKLKVLGALTMADQAATGFATHISDFQIDGNTWKNSVDDYIQYLQATAKEVKRDQLTLNVLQIVDVVRQCGKKYTATPVSKIPTKFLNRLMGIPILMQKWVLDGITNSIEEQRRKTKNFDCGIKDYKLGPGVLSNIIEKTRFNLNDGNVLVLNRIEIDKSLPLCMAKDLIKRKPDCQFKRTNSGPAILFSKVNGTFLVYRPHNCVASTLYGFEERCLQTIPQKLLEKLWKRQVRAMVRSPGQCAHHYIKGRCDKSSCSNNDVAKYEIYLLTGPLSLFWDDIKKAVFGSADNTAYLQALRLTATNMSKMKEKLIGVMIPACNLPSLIKSFNN